MVSHSGCPPYKYIINTIRWSCVKGVSSIDIRWPLSKGHCFDHNGKGRIRRYIDPMHFLERCGETVAQETLLKETALYEMHRIHRSDAFLFASHTQAPKQWCSSLYNGVPLRTMVFLCTSSFASRTQAPEQSCSFSNISNGVTSATALPNGVA